MTRAGDLWRSGEEMSLMVQVLTVPKRRFRLTPINGHRQTGAVGPVRATFGLMQRSKISWLFDSPHEQKSSALYLRDRTKPQRAAMPVYRLGEYCPRLAFNTDD